jgi:hypothetical protein
MADSNRPNGPLYTPADLAWFRENWRETEWLVHVTGTDDVLLYSDDRDSFDPGGDHEGTVPHTLETADKAAKAINATYAYTQANNPSEFDPHFRATVFHYGRPLAAPEAVPEPGPFSAEDLTWFKAEYGETPWMAYVHGMDECFERRNEDDEPFTEDTVRKYAADMAIWNREHVAQGLEPSAVTVFYFGEPVPAVAK